MDHKLDKLSEDFFNYLIKHYPPLASHVGIHDYDEEMPEATLKSVEEFHAKRQEFYDDVEAIDPASLSPERRIDRDALLTSFGVKIFEDEAHGRWRSMPSTLMEFGAAFYSLFIKEFAPLPHRIEKIAARLEKTPRYLENSKETLTDPVDVWVKMGIDECDSMAGFITLIQTTAHKDGVGKEVLVRLDAAVEKAQASLADYKKWLQDEILPEARTDFAMKPEDFETLIAKRELGVNCDELIKFGYESLAYAREMQKKTAEEIAPGKTVEEVGEMLEKIHPETFEEALELTAEAVERSRNFVRESGYATLVEGEKLLVIETPAFARNFIPFGAYMPPGPFDKKQIGHYWMSSPRTEQGQDMSIHCKGAILNTSVHEGYPGHHLQLTCANTNPSPSRRLTDGIEFVEGWAHYCEEKVAEMGFSMEPEVMFERYNDMVWRAARIIVDVKLSRGEISFDEAVELLHKETGFDKNSCITEIKRYTFSPGYQLSYLHGKKMIMDLVESVKKDAGDEFSYRKFHDAMLYAGTLPMKHMASAVRLAFGLEMAAVK